MNEYLTRTDERLEFFRKSNALMLPKRRAEKRLKDAVWMLSKRMSPPFFCVCYMPDQQTKQDNSSLENIFWRTRS